MGREVRKVPAHWQHPTDGKGRYVPLFDGYTESAHDWVERAAAWHRGDFPSYASAEDSLLTFEEWDVPHPDPVDYMPDWPDKQRTHYMMYETTTEGTPISPAFETPEALAEWLVSNEASAFGDMTASYESWLRVARGGYAPSAVVAPGQGLVSGVQGLTKD